MADTSGTLGTGRVGLKELFGIEAKKVPAQWKDVIGRSGSTTQTSEVYKQYAGLGPAVQTPEGNKVAYDDLAPGFVVNVKPLNYTKGVKLSILAEKTDQYGILKNLTPDFARAFMHRRNMYAADLDNSGFTDTTKGANSETLYATGHYMVSTNGLVGNNRPLAPGQVAGTSATVLDLAFGPLALEQAWSDVRGQQSARGTPQYVIGNLDIKVPRQLYMQALRALKSVKLPGTNNNDDNVVRAFFNDPKLIDYYTSSTAWFIKAADPAEHGLVWLDQMPYDIKPLPEDDELVRKWIAYESYAMGWKDWHGTYGTLGA